MSNPNEIYVPSSAELRDALRTLINRLEQSNAELLASLTEILPYATRAIHDLNKQMVGDLYPAINLAKLERAEKAIANAKGKS